MEYRKLTLSDLDMVMNMENDFRKDFVEIKNVKYFLKSSKNWIFACILNNKIIGFAYGYELNRLDRDENMLYIHEVGVLPEYQRKGIGTEIINGIKYLCKMNRICYMFLFTQKSNTGACKLYEKTGGERSWDAKENDDDRSYFFQVK
jgi:ribosomal protein S18 acetylase RimI-like enzyme